LARLCFRERGGGDLAQIASTRQLDEMWHNKKNVRKLNPVRGKMSVYVNGKKKGVWGESQISCWKDGGRGKLKKQEAAQHFEKATKAKSAFRRGKKKDSRGKGKG